MKVAICGGGVIGTSTAYFLSRRNVEAVVVERTGVANGASGKSGGFLALDWCDGTLLAPMARRSFALHGQLAAEIGANWGYRRVDTLGVVASARRDISAYRKLPSPGWLGDGAAVHGQLGTPASTAQINPAAFTHAMMTAAIENGATLVNGCAEGISRDSKSGHVTGVMVDGAVLRCDAAVIALGPWSILACEWLPLGATMGSKGHSLVFDYAPSPQSLFVELETDDGEIAAPEINPRPDGTTYVCGLSGHDALPNDPADVLPEPGATENLRRMTALISPDLAAAKVLAVQACYRPLTVDGLPQIGQVTDVPGAYVATGHNVWGMLNAPATGEAMAELIVEGRATTIDLAHFDPARLEPG